MQNVGSILGRVLLVLAKKIVVVIAIENGEVFLANLGNFQACIQQHEHYLEWPDWIISRSPARTCRRGHKTRPNKASTISGEFANVFRPISLAPHLLRQSQPQMMGELETSHQGMENSGETLSYAKEEA